MCSSPTRLTSRPTSCARCRTRSRTLSPTWRSRAAPTASIFSAACSMRRPYMLRAGGLFACELYEGALDAAAELCRQAGLSDVRIVHDLTDRPRIVRAIVTEPKQRI